MIEAQIATARAIDGLKMGLSSDKGAEQVTVLFKLKGGPNNGDNIEWTGYLTDKTLARTNESLRYMGWDGVDDKSVMKNDVSLVIEIDEYKGKQRAKVQWVNSLAGNAKPMTTAQSQSARQRLQAAEAARKAAAGNSEITTESGAKF
jgi:hypothetical protein